MGNYHTPAGRTMEIILPEGHITEDINMETCKQRCHRPIVIISDILCSQVVERRGEGRSMKKHTPPHTHNEREPEWNYHHPMPKLLLAVAVGAARRTCGTVRASRVRD